MSAKTDRFFLSEEQSQSLVAQIRKAENMMSGEIRIHIENRHGGDAYQRAVAVFEQLAMHRTELRNGVLLYVAVADRSFVILGDKGINDLVPDNFWDLLTAQVIADFKKDMFLEGLSYAIKMAAEKLMRFFPHERGDVDELKNDISYLQN